ncbi:ABC transporter permease subunit [Paracoccus sp. R12_1]|uniref:ABC transporter permease subunit n=1 Tax=unclassified Paracoccus (in: a-proteobacteria) TaxID=2688777 RepID=UPI001AD9AAB8|nr:MULTISPECIES: ABC transporter permease subunit [unclassified Paracoccus (in: a-proteobacteria)]MBO9456988.1 ABC transporter permease subunit [Paracoccus sp. R12_2]MBO9488127.1 ABC transporter permease subunit [Paracoccus sp. R12_1]
MTFWRNRRARAAILQFLYVGSLIAIVAIGAITARKNLDAQGITSSFDFLWKSTGWDIPFSLLPASSADPYWWYLLMGVLNTLFLGVIGLACATVVGGLVGLARVSENHAARLLGTIYVETFRNIPLIVQVFFWYALANRLPRPKDAIEIGGLLISNRGIYVPGLNVVGGSVAGFFLILFATLFGLIWFASARRFKRIDPSRKRAVGLGVAGAAALLAILVIWMGHEPGTPIMTMPEAGGLNIRGGYRIQPEIYTLAFAIAVYGGAYIGEIVRGGFKSVGRGQTEAARSLGLTGWQVFSRVRLPLALRSMLPILTNQYVWLIKATTLGIVVGFSDFFMVIASSITHSGQTLEFVGILMAGFLIINFSLAAVMNRINKAVALKGHQLRS